MTDALGMLPVGWQDGVRIRLGPGEALLGWFEPDLDQRLRYAHGLVVVTDRQVLAAEEGGLHWQAWPLEAGADLRVSDDGAAGTLELLGPDARLGHWRFTAGSGAGAQRLVQRLADLRARRSGKPPAPSAAVCPSCGEPMSPDEGRCPRCAAGPARPSLSALWRLVGFARPRAGMVIVGFALTLAGTTAGLVPPYLTMPLLDNVLIPHQNGRPVDFGLVYW